MSENIETEVKIKLNKSEFDKRLKQLWPKGFGEPEFLQEDNYFYEVPKGFLRLKCYGNKVKATFKGPRQGSDNVNSRKEIEFQNPIEDYDKLVEFYESIGLRRCFQYSKKRANYVRGFVFGEGYTTISFDILPTGDRYIEIEDSEEAIEKVVALLNLENFPREKRSYLEMLMERGDENCMY